MVLPVPQHVNSCRAEPANWALTLRVAGVVAAVGAVLDGDCLHSLSSPAPPAAETPVSVPPPRPVWLSLPPWLTVLRGLGTLLHLLSGRPTTTGGRAKIISQKFLFVKASSCDFEQHTLLLIYLSCVSPAVTPLFKSSVSLFKFLFEPGRLSAGSRGQEGRGGARGTLAWRKMLPDISAHTIEA